MVHHTFLVYFCLQNIPILTKFYKYWYTLFITIVYFILIYILYTNLLNEKATLSWKRDEKILCNSNYLFIDIIFVKN